MTRRKRRAATSTRHLDESTPTNRNFSCQGRRPLPTTRRYLQTNYRNRSHQIRRIVSSSFSLLLLYKREDVRRRQYFVLIKIGYYLVTWLLLSPLCSSCSPMPPPFSPILFISNSISLSIIPPFYRLSPLQVRHKSRLFWILTRNPLASFLIKAQVIVLSIYMIKV